MRKGILVLSVVATFASCNSEKVEDNKEVVEVLEVVDDINYEKQGFTLAMTTKGILGKNLMGTITKEGTDAALTFCSLNAIHLVDSMSTELNASIKRVTDKPRNPNNKANTEELAYIEAGKKLLLEGKELTPKMKEDGDKVIGYYPITTNVMCMQCHGEPETQIKATTLSKLKTLYPEDLAQGYTENQLRGIWVVEMNKK